MTERDWVSDFHALAERGARLLGVHGEFYERRRSADEKRDWPGSWLRAIVAKQNFHDQDWPGGLWLDFAAAPLLRFEPLTSGEGFRLELEESLPTPASEPWPWGRYVDDLTELPPFSAVVGTSLQAIAELAYAAGPPGSDGWDLRSPSNPPVGIRLMFERGEVWLLNIADEMEVYDRRPVYWQTEDPYLDLREWKSCS